eukprot:scaffold2782_cov328-Prasinococcus_capsulatus_cf.AAC.5
MPSLSRSDHPAAGFAGTNPNVPTHVNLTHSRIAGDVADRRYRHSRTPRNIHLRGGPEYGYGPSSGPQPEGTMLLTESAHSQP